MIYDKKLSRNCICFCMYFESKILRGVLLSVRKGKHPFLPSIEMILVIYTNRNQQPGHVYNHTLTVIDIDILFV